MKKHWSGLEHRIWKILKDHEATDKKIILCVSGGADSIALFHILSKVHKKDLLKVFHYHHGPGPNGKFRDQALEMVRQLSVQHKISFHTEKSPTELKNETECRWARRDALKKFWKKGELIATGHHQQDLLETRMMRMIRGTGGQGLPAMMEYRRPWLRPLLGSSREELKSYLRSLDLKWLDDPTNLEEMTLRNWLRLTWFPLLEKKYPGSTKALTRSLENLVSQWSESSLQVPRDEKLSRSYYLACSQKEQRELLSRWFYQQRIRNFSRAQIEEIQRQLDKRHNDFKIEVGPLRLKVNAKQILLIRQRE